MNTSSKVCGAMYAFAALFLPQPPSLPGRSRKACAASGSIWIWYTTRCRSLLLRRGDSINTEKMRQLGRPPMSGNTASGEDLGLRRIALAPPWSETIFPCGGNPPRNNRRGFPSPCGWRLEDTASPFTAFSATRNGRGHRFLVTASLRMGKALDHYLRMEDRKR